MTKVELIMLSINRMSYECVRVVCVYLWPVTVENVFHRELYGNGTQCEGNEMN